MPIRVRMMSDVVPEITFLTPCRNAAATLPEALESVRRCKGVAHEHVVIDGGSNDGTQALLAAAPGVRWSSGPDRNLYDALNKGLRMARGEFLQWINADDLAEAGFAPRAVAMLRERPDVDAVYGDTVVIDAAGAEIGRRRQRDGELDDHLRVLRGAGFVQINAFVFRKTLFDRIGGFDDRFPVAGDFEFVVRMAERGCRAARVPEIAYRFRLHSSSMTTGRGGGVAALDDTVRLYEALIAENRVPERWLPRLRRGIGRIGLLMAAEHLLQRRPGRAVRWLGRVVTRYPTGFVDVPEIAGRIGPRLLGRPRAWFWLRPDARFW